MPRTGRPSRWCAVRLEVEHDVLAARASLREIALPQIPRQVLDPVLVRERLVQSRLASPGGHGECCFGCDEPVRQVRTDETGSTRNQHAPSAPESTIHGRPRLPHAMPSGRRGRRLWRTRTAPRNASPMAADPLTTRAPMQVMRRHSAMDSHAGTRRTFVPAAHGVTERPEEVEPYDAGAWLSPWPGG